MCIENNESFNKTERKGRYAEDYPSQISQLKWKPNLITNLVVGL